jgi:hypothetical protein
MPASQSHTYQEQLHIYTGSIGRFHRSGCALTVQPRRLLADGVGEEVDGVRSPM